MAEEFVGLKEEDIPEYIEKNGLEGIEKLCKEKLERWKEVGINFGVTGDSGAGKSSFINAIRGLRDDDVGAAKTGVTETTTEAAVYSHPTNGKIKFWDLPGIGTLNYPDLETYVKKVGLEKYDTFLIFTATRFTKNDQLLAERVNDINKSFFFVRTKIDQDINNESDKRAFNEETTLNHIREDCWKNLELAARKMKLAAGEIVFLISNRKRAKWDFGRLQQAILDVLPLRQKQSLALSLDLLTSRSKNLLKEKVKVLRGRMLIVAATSGFGAVVPVPGLSVAIDLALLTKEVNFYRSQLGLPEENSSEFRKLNPKIQESVRKFCLTSAVQIGQLIAAYAASAAVEEVTKFIPLVGSFIAGTLSFTTTYCFLKICLNEIEETAFNCLDEINARVADDMDLD